MIEIGKSMLTMGSIICLFVLISISYQPIVADEPIENIDIVEEPIVEDDCTCIGNPIGFFDFLIYPICLTIDMILIFVYFVLDPFFTLLFGDIPLFLELLEENILNGSLFEKLDCYRWIKFP